MAAPHGRSSRERNKAGGGRLSARSLLVRAPYGVQAIAIGRTSWPISGLHLLNTTIIITGGIKESVNETFL
jgi:hypothetical protein